MGKDKKGEINVEDIFNDEKIEGIKQVIKDHQLKQREIQLYQLNFTKIVEMSTYYKYDNGEDYYVDFDKINNCTSEEWGNLLSDLKIEIKQDFIKYLKKIHTSFEYNFAVEEKNKQIKDKINALKSKLAEEKRQKLTKTINQERVKELEVQIKILQEICG